MAYGVENKKGVNDLWDARSQRTTTVISSEWKVDTGTSTSSKT